MELYGNKNLTGKERFFDADDVIVTKTDLTGKITYCNRTFCEISGYKESDVLGQQHNIIRHPEMPRCVFDLLWSTIKNSEEVFAYVNNRAVNGDYYWVLAHVTPSFDSQGNIISYHSNRRVPNRQIINDNIIPLYENLIDIEKSASSPSEGLKAGSKAISDLLEKNKVTYNEFIFSLEG